LECDFLAGSAFCKTNPHLSAFTSPFNTDILNLKKKIRNEFNFSASKTPEQDNIEVVFTSGTQRMLRGSLFHLTLYQFILK
jgi:hypothetical protein